MNMPERLSLEQAAARDALRVLLIDDESHVRSYLRTTLGLLGVSKVLEAPSGHDGIAAFEEQRPDLVLLDANLPDMGGEQVIGEILARDPGAAVAVVTSESRHDRVKAFCNAGAIAYILKHLPPREVSAQLEEILDCFEPTGEEQEAKACSANH